MIVELDYIEAHIAIVGWYHFGEKEINCPGISKKYIQYYRHNHTLPSPCDMCYKALVFWAKENFPLNVKNFALLLDSLEISYRGKLNKEVAVFYFADKDSMLKFVQCLEKKLKDYNINGGIQWRRACKRYQDEIPALWVDAKTFIPDNKLQGD
jgi:hypothetical protein